MLLEDEASGRQANRCLFVPVPSSPQCGFGAQRCAEMCSGLLRKIDRCFWMRSRSYQWV